VTQPDLRAPDDVWLDGPMGTMLEAARIPAPLPAWSAFALRARPEAIAAVHAAWASAGATVHTAATFRTTPTAVGGLATRWTEAAVALARRAVPRHHRVLGALAPLEDCWSTAPTRADAARHHRAQAERLATAGVDGLLVETFLHIEEAILATEAAAATGRPVWTSLTPGFAAAQPSLPALDGLDRLRQAGADVLLMNCGPLRHADAWADALSRTGGPWGLYVNLYEVAPDAFAAASRRWRTAGAGVVGACCGATPSHLLAARSAAESP
jgi:S-methylmethionine-dependent homocysteine/selenocysteine methylase